MNILVIGSGAVGSIAAGILSKQGFHVDLACKNSELSDQINTDGLIFSIRHRKYLYFIPAYASVEATPGNYDYVLLSTKTFDIEPPTRAVLEKLSPQGLIVSMQDGYCEEKLARIAGSNRIVGAVVSWGATLSSDGIAAMTSPGEMIIGKLDGSDDPRLDNLQYLLSTIGSTRVVKNINEHIYSKLIINSCVTTLGAISGLKVGALITDRNLRNIFIKIIREAILIANALNIEIPDFAGKLNYYRLVKGNNWYYRLKRHAKIRIFGLRYRNIKSSGLQSLERGEKTETSFLNGYLLTKARELGVELPVNERLVSMIQEIENGTRKISPSNLNDPLLRTI
ncbi:MAG: ketopantoate reductase family protein [Prolixibacteraceae bacterium]|nr:ketopantoate reductase family protein [Prolixibacteraceae bacterium]